MSSTEAAISVYSDIVGGPSEFCRVAKIRRGGQWCTGSWSSARNPSNIPCAYRKLRTAPGVDLPDATYDDLWCYSSTTAGRCRFQAVGKCTQTGGSVITT